MSTSSPEYVTVDAVKKVCSDLGIRDWTALSEPKITEEEAQSVLGALGVRDLDVPLEDFRRGLEVELEHGTEFDDCNVTNNHPVLTGKIVLAHLRESLDYYKRLEVAELEGDIFKAVLAGDHAKLERLYRELAVAKAALHNAERAQLAGSA